MLPFGKQKEVLNFLSGMAVTNHGRSEGIWLFP